MKRKACMFCGTQYDDGIEATIDYKNVRVTEFIINAVQSCEMCSSCRDRFTITIEKFYDDAQIRRYTIDKLLALTEHSGIRAALDGCPEEFTMDYFSALVDSKNLLLDTDMYMVINRVGYANAYSKLSAIQIAAITNRDLKCVIDKLMEEVPRVEWRDDIKLCKKYGVDKCCVTLFLEKDPKEFLN